MKGGIKRIRTDSETLVSVSSSSILFSLRVVRVPSLLHSAPTAFASARANSSASLSVAAVTTFPPVP